MTTPQNEEPSPATVEDAEWLINITDPALRVALYELEWAAETSTDTVEITTEEATKALLEVDAILDIDIGTTYLEEPTEEVVVDATIELDTSHLALLDRVYDLENQVEGQLDDQKGFIEWALDQVVDEGKEALGLGDADLPLLDPITAAILEGIGQAVGRLSGELVAMYLEFTLPIAMKFTEGVFEGLSTVEVDTEQFKKSFRDMMSSMQEAMAELGAQLQ